MLAIIADLLEDKSPGDKKVRIAREYLNSLVGRLAIGYTTNRTEEKVINGYFTT